MILLVVHGCCNQQHLAYRWSHLAHTITIDIYVDSNGTRDHLFSQYIDPKNLVSHRRWHERELDLAAWAGQTVTITFSTDPGPNQDARYDWAGWGDLKLLVP